MERSEPSLVPEWLRAGLAAPHLGLYQDDAGSLLGPRSRLTQQQITFTGNHVDYDSPRGSTSSDRQFSSSRRNNNGINNLPNDRNGENINLGRSHSNLTRSSLSHGHDRLERDRDGYRGDGARFEREGDRDFRSRERDRLVGFGPLDKDRERERLENGMLRISAAKLQRSHSMALSPRFPEVTPQKTGETGNVTSGVASLTGTLASSIQKAAFERNFPSLGSEEKSGGFLLSPGSSCISSPRPLWQGPPRMDLGRAASPGLPVNFGGATSTSQSLGGGVSGADLWSSALAEVPPSNGSPLMNTSNMNTIPASSSGSMSAALCISTPAVPVTALNMAEALTQPPRVRTPPQSYAESQRLEGHAFKVSRPLVPMTPSLPKTMSLTDKNKPKSLRLVDNGVKGSIKSSQPLVNPLHRSLTPGSKPDSPKQLSGKLLLRKSSKDTSVSSKAEGSSALQAALGNFPANGSVSAGPRKPVLDHSASFSGLDTSVGSRAKDLTEDKRAQNRSAFFNTIRRKAAGNGSSSPLHQVNTGVESIGCITEVDEKVGDASQEPLAQQSIHSNGDVKCPLLEEVINVGEEPLMAESLSDSKSHIPLPVDSEEEEVAFMRSIGWEENAENSELTEEEINAFYQMREKNEQLTTQDHCNKLVVSSVGSIPILSSSDSESEDELRVPKE